MNALPMTLVPLPSKSPELNPVENIWRYMRENWLSNRIFANYEDILNHCCFNWNKLVERPSNARGSSCRSEGDGLIGSDF
jgi:transposase